MPSSRIEELVYTLPGITLAGIASGSGPLALCFHGITANGRVFEPIVSQLSRRFHAVSLDQRGHGRSGKPASGYGGEAFAGDIAALVREIDRGPALLIGHSLGARNALVAGMNHPDLVAGVVAIDFTPFIETKVLDDLETRVNAGDREFENIEAVKSYLAARYKRMPPDAVERRARHGYVATPSGLRPLADPNAMRQTASGLREDLEPVVRDIRVPVLLMRGADSALVSPVAWGKTRALRPDLPAVEIRDADHYVPEEAPDAVVDEINRFWTGIEEKKK
jgi:2-(acetamidomethylene)succinate hydrolase